VALPLELSLHNIDPLCVRTWSLVEAFRKEGMVKRKRSLLAVSVVARNRLRRFVPWTRGDVSRYRVVYLGYKIWYHGRQRVITGKEKQHAGRL
jgi:hypothetical protein